MSLRAIGSQVVTSFFYGDRTCFHIGGSGTDSRQTASGNSRAIPGESFVEFPSIRTARRKLTTRPSDRLPPASSQGAGNSGVLRIVASFGGLPVLCKLPALVFNETWGARFIEGSPPMSQTFLLKNYKMSDKSAKRTDSITILTTFLPYRTKVIFGFKPHLFFPAPLTSG
jgi:hypothetical protein